MIEAELPDGTVLEFPEGTSQEVIQRVVRQQLGVSDEATQEDGGMLAPFRKEDQTFGQALYENIVGEGEVDTIGEQIGDVIGSGIRGLVRGGKSALELPEMAGRGAVALGQLATGQDEIIPVTDTLTGNIIEGAYNVLDPIGPDLSERGQTTAGQYVGTAAEFVGGGAGLAPVATGVSKGLRAANMARGADIASDIGKAGLTAEGAKVAAVSGVGSEALGQATEDTALEPYARIVGAFAAPAAASRVSDAFKTVKKTGDALRKQSTKTPALEAAEQQKNTSYKEFDDLANQYGVKGGLFKVDDVIDDLSAKVAKEQSEGGTTFTSYITGAESGLNKLVDDAVAIVTSRKGQDFNASMMNSMIKELNAVVGKAKGAPQVRFIRDAVDDYFQQKSAEFAKVLGGDASKALKKANADARRYYKIREFEDAMLDAELGAAATGSGGNIVNQYRNAVRKILRNPKKRMQFDQDELVLMQRFVTGSFSENIMRLMSKFSPSGNGLMAALNVGAIAANPAMAGVTVTGMAAKRAIDSKTLKSVEQIKDTIISGVRPQYRDKVAKDLMKIIGSYAGMEQ